MSLTAITDPSRRYGGDPLRGRRSTYCSPMADTLRTWATRSAGIFGVVPKVRVACAPLAVSLMSVTLPTWTPR